MRINHVYKCGAFSFHVCRLPRLLESPSLTSHKVKMKAMALTIDDAATASMTAACASGDLSSLQRLLSNSSENSDETIFTLLQEATEHKHLDIVECLIEKSTNVDFPSELIRKAAWSGKEMYQLYLERNPNILEYHGGHWGTALCVAVAIHDTQLLLYLLAHSADPGRSLESPKWAWHFLPLEYAAYTSAHTNARLLIEHGATLRNTAALQLATCPRRRLRGLEMVRILVEAGIDVNGMVDENDVSVDQSLVNPGARKTALHVAAEEDLRTSQSIYWNMAQTHERRILWDILRKTMPATTIITRLFFCCGLKFRRIRKTL